MYQNVILKTDVKEPTDFFLPEKYFEIMFERFFKPKILKLLAYWIFFQKLGFEIRTSAQNLKEFSNLRAFEFFLIIDEIVF